MLLWPGWLRAYIEISLRSIIKLKSSFKHWWHKKRYTGYFIALSLWYKHTELSSMFGSWAVKLLAQPPDSTGSWVEWVTRWDFTFPIYSVPACLQLSAQVTRQGSQGIPSLMIHEKMLEGRISQTLVAHGSVSRCPWFLQH